jgi:hypothetical protein
MGEVGVEWDLVLQIKLMMIVIVISCVSKRSIT